MKTLRADKCKDGYVVIITDRLAISCESDVYKIIRENGLRYNKQYSHKPDKDNKEEWIYAD